MSVVVTIMIATHNGAGTLGRTLDALGKVDFPASDMKIIVIDNASSDNTGEILRSYAPKLPLTSLYCPQRGKNAALNSAISSIEGELVLFTDDDVVPDSRWVRTMVDAAGRFPDYGIFGGVIQPLWPSPPPEWILRDIPLDVAYATKDRTVGDQEIPPQGIWGCNLMVRSRLFQIGHRFNDQVGPAAGNYVMGSETEFLRRMAALGERARFVPDSIVGHIVRPPQLTIRWLLGRAMRSGKAECANHGAELIRGSTTIAGIPRWMVGRAVYHALAALVKGWTLRPNATIRHLWWLYWFRGFLDYFRQNRTTIMAEANTCSQ